MTIEAKETEREKGREGRWEGRRGVIKDPAGPDDGGRGHETKNEVVSRS